MNPTMFKVKPLVIKIFVVGVLLFSNLAYAQVKETYNSENITGRDVSFSLGGEAALGYHKDFYKKAPELDSLLSNRIGLRLNVGFVSNMYIARLGFHWYIPRSDSAEMLLENRSISGYFKNVTSYVSSTAYEIPIHYSYSLSIDNEFITPYVGLTFAFYRNKTTYYFSEDLSLYHHPYSTSYFNNNVTVEGNTVVVKRKGGRVMLQAGAYYELEKFRVFGELGFNYALNFDDADFVSPNSIHLQVGIHIPFLTSN